jgi:hypothetical protein
VTGRSSRETLVMKQVNLLALRLYKYKAQFNF